MKPHRRVMVLAGLGGLAALVVLRLALSRSDDPSLVVASGTVEATEAELGFERAGRIETIGVREGDRVERGQELAALERAERLARRRAAEAQAEAARAFLAELEGGFRVEEVAQGRSAVRAAQQRLSEARRELERTRRLHEGGALSQQALDSAETAHELTQAEYESAQEALRILETGPRQERIAAQRAVLAQAEAAIAQIDAELEQAVIRAPFAGIVSVRHREPGETVGAGAPVLTLLDPDDRWVRIFVREDQVGRIALGERAAISGDANPGRAYDGEVIYIASEAEFTPRNVQTTEERVKLVYRVKVRVAGDPSYDLKPGLAADVRLGEREP